MLDVSREKPSTDLEEKIICIVGPTATGKSDVSQLLAEDIGGEIVSADSMQVYRGMDIGTAKMERSMRTVPYHCIDLVDPDEQFSASLYQDAARRAFVDIAGRNRRSVLVGGTGFYIRAAVDDYDFPEGEQKDNPVRQRWEEYFQNFGREALFDRLLERDPDSEGIVHPNNVKRVIRALEVIESGSKYSELKKNLGEIEQLFPAVFYGLNMDRDTLHDRIDQRVDKMREAGLLEEVESLLARGFREGITSIQAIGYKELISYIDGLISIDEAFDQIKRSSRRYAKRQLTWFNKDERIQWIDCTDRDIEDIYSEISERISSNEI